MTVSLLALAASHRANSLNRTLLQHAIPLAEQAGAQVRQLDYDACESPLYRGEHTSLPQGAQYLADALLAHDGLLLASPEYNWSIPAGLKNLIDWLSVDPRAPLRGRTALLLCASPSARGGISGLQQVRVPLELLGMWVYPQMVGIGDAANTLQQGALLRPKDQLYLQNTVQDFVRATGALSHAH